jgi:hypothetical protein
MKTKFGKNAIGLETPLWAKWVFRVFMILSGAATFIVASDPHIPSDIKVSVAVWLKGADMAIFGLSKMFGISIENGK